MVTMTKVDLHVDLQPDSQPVSVVYPIRTHTLRVIESTATSSRLIACWRLAVHLVPDVDNTGEPWSYRIEYTIEEAIEVTDAGGKAWLIRYSYKQHDHALAHIERLAASYLDNR